jgi:hypothetical protein
MMIIVNRTGDNITGSYNGKPFGVAYSDQKYQAMKDLEQQANEVETVDELQVIIEEFEPLTRESFKELIEHEKGGQYLWVDPRNNKVYLSINGKVARNALPKALVDRIITSVEKKIDVMPLVKCWARFMRPITGKPAYSEERARQFAQYIDADYTNFSYADQLVEENGLSQEVANARATTKQVAITQEGLIVGYKVSREILTKYDLNEDEEVVQKSRYTKAVDPDTGLVTYDTPKFVEDRLFEPAVMGNRGDEFFCGDKAGHFIRVGQVHFLDSWDKVGNPGHKGLHMGGLRYIQNYQTDGTVTHNIFVDPMHIYGINSVSEDGAMTVKQYYVHSSFAGPNRGIYHSSNYAKMTDAEYEKLIEEAVGEHARKIAELDLEIVQATNLSQI